jgi:hypothetical protein
MYLFCLRVHNFTYRYCCCPRMSSFVTSIHKVASDNRVGLVDELAKVLVAPDTSFVAPLYLLDWQSWHVVSILLRPAYRFSLK